MTKNQIKYVSKITQVTKANPSRGCPTKALILGTELSLWAFLPDFQILFCEHSWMDKSCLEILESIQFGYNLRYLDWINKKISMMHNKYILLILPQDRLGNAKSQWLKITKVYFSFTLYVCYESVKVLLFIVIQEPRLMVWPISWILLTLTERKREYSKVRTQKSPSHCIGKTSHMASQS